MINQMTYSRRAFEVGGTVHAARYAGSLRHFTTACAVYPAPEVDRLDASSATDVTCRACRAALAGFVGRPYRGDCDDCRTYWNTCQDIGEEFYAAPPADRPPLSDPMARALAMYGEHAFGHFATEETR